MTEPTNEQLDEHTTELWEEINEAIYEYEKASEGVWLLEQSSVPGEVQRVLDQHLLSAQHRLRHAKRKLCSTVGDLNAYTAKYPRDLNDLLRGQT